ncbi:MAG: exodeoxyribonuclease VII large subunit [Elusimicrobiota bacterium]
MSVEALPDALSITELNRLVKAGLERDFGDVWVQGEISNAKAAPSGHVYFTLKDAGAQISAALFRGDAARIKFELEQGLEVLARGRVTLYEARGSFQIVVREIRPKSAGALQLAFEQLKKKLAAEGLFAEERKKPLPPFPRRIGIITSRTGAAVRDMLSVLGRRFDGLHIRLYPVTVQGTTAAPEIAEAIADFNAHFPDTELLLVGRGGGSLEDLWAFNEEAVARAIAASNIPVISCVGHETDFTIADFVADLRAPTPSAAAELAVCERAALEDKIARLEQRLTGSAGLLVQTLSERLRRLTRSPFLRHPERIFEQQVQRIDELTARLAPGLRRLVARAEERLKAAARLEGPIRQRLRLAAETLRRHAERLDALSPLKVLARGYAIAFKDGKAVRAAAEVKPGDRLRVRLHRGEIKTEVI